MDFCEFYHYIVLGVLIGTASLIGLIGNTISLLVLSRQPQTPTFLLLKAMCFSDNLYLIVNIIVRAIGKLTDWYDCVTTAVINKWVWPFGTIGLNCTAWLTVLITLYRYIAVTRPLHARAITTLRRTYIIIAVIVTYTSLMTIPRFFEYDIIQLENSTCVDFVYTNMYENRVYQIVYKTVLILFMYAFIPPLVCVIFTIRIAFSLHKFRQQRANMSLSVRDINAREMHTTKVSIIVVVMYLVGQIPSVIGVIRRMVGGFDLNNNCLTYFYYINATEFVLVLNCSVNFFIYIASSDSFRNSLVNMFKNIFKCRCCKRESSVPKKNTDSSLSSDIFDISNTYFVSQENVSQDVTGP